MAERFQGKVVVVTGAGSGIGRATALAFAAEGAAVVAADIVQSTGEDTLREVIARGGRCIFVEADVSKEVDVKRLIDSAVSTYGGLDVLHNNAGVTFSASVVDTSEADWDRVLDVNLKGAFLCSKHAIPAMVKRGGGAIVNTSSVLGLRAARRAAAYVTAEGGLIALTRAIAADHSGQGIRVNCICAGLTDTDMVRRAADISSPGNGHDVVSSWGASLPVGRIGTPEDIASAVLFLASPESSYITGTTLIADGGVLARMG